MNKTVIECWNILKYVIESIIDQFDPLKNQGKQSRNTCQKKQLKNNIDANYVEGLPERMKTT